MHSVVSYFFIYHNLNIMEEQLLSFGTANLAKDKGCDLYLYRDNEWHYIDEEGDEFWCNYDPRVCYPNAQRLVQCSQSLLQKWLREKHSLYIILEETETLSLDSGIGFYYKIIKVKDKEHLRLDYNMYFYKTYEEALEAGLKEALQLI